MKGFPSKSFRKLIRNALQLLDDCCPETLPAELRVRYHLCELNYAVRQAHFPDSPEALQAARRRIEFERILLYLVYVSCAGTERQSGFPFQFSNDCIDRYWQSLGFIPTNAQKKGFERYRF